MGAIRNNNYFVIHGWMINEMELKGTELQVYAIIYGFAQADGQSFKASLQYLADWTNSTRRTVLNCLQSLVEKGFLIKEDSYENGVKACEYRATIGPDDIQMYAKLRAMLPCSGEKNSTGVVKKLPRGGEKISTGVVKKFPEGGEKISPNNYIDKDIYKDIDKECVGEFPADAGNLPSPAPEKSIRFVPPTLEEVQAYCRERGNKVNAARFLAYYTSVNWYRGKTKIKDWKACVRTWEHDDRQPGGQAPQMASRSRVKSEAEHAAGQDSSGFGW